MPQRRRFATREELAALLAQRLSDQPTPDEIVEVLTALGAPMDALVVVITDEPIEP